MIQQSEFNYLQTYFLAVYGPALQYVLVGFVAVTVAVVILIIALALLRRMLMGPVGP